MTGLTLNNTHLSEDEIFVFEFTQKGEKPQTTTGYGDFDNESVAVVLNRIINPVERDINSSVDVSECKKVLALRFYQPESIDALIHAAIRAKEKLMKGRAGRMNETRRKVSYKEFETAQEGYCLLITGGMMSPVSAIIERYDGTMTEIPIDRVQFLDADAWVGFRSKPKEEV
jgi:hypothetical protein